MNLLAALLVSTFAQAANPPAPPAPSYAPLLAEQTLGPVPHTAVRDQGDVGFCWAYSMAGYMEGEALKKGRRVTLSPEYLALNHMPSLMYQFLPVFELIDGQGFFARLLLDLLIVPMISPEGGASFSEALSDAAEIGMVPESVYSKKFPFGKDAQGNKVEIHPTLQERVRNFAYAKLTRTDWVKYYEANPKTFRKDFLEALGVQVPNPTSTFTYEGQTYTPVSFMRDYLGFNPDEYQEVVIMKGQYQSLFDKLKSGGLNTSGIKPIELPKPVTGLSQADAFNIIRTSLQDQTAVPVAYIVYEDQKSAEASGVFSPKNCANGACAKMAGGHAVLITGMKENAGQTDAIIIKNSWGASLGLDDQGASLKGSDRGFFLITPPYLTQAENQANLNGWSFLVQKRYLPR